MDRANTIAMTPFALRHWDRTSGATQVTEFSPDDLVAKCNASLAGGRDLVDGYAPFCKHLFIANDTSFPCAFTALTDANRPFLKTGYNARRDGELAVLERWLEGVEPPRAHFLDVILYSHAQLEAEAAASPSDDVVPDCDWGIVALIGTLEEAEPPMPPITQLRNALGKEEGGSGVPIDRQAYASAVAFWDAHVAIK